MNEFIYSILGDVVVYAMIMAIIVLAQSLGKSKIEQFNLVSWILLSLLLIIQFFLPIAKKGNETITAFQGIQYINYSWTFSYFYFIILLSLLQAMLNIMHSKKKFPYKYDFSLWGISFIGLFIYMIALQGFLNLNSLLGIKDYAANAVGVFLIIFIYIFMLIEKLNIDFKEIGEKIKANMITKEFKKEINNEKILYEENILLNPKWNFIFTRPTPIKMAITEKNVLFSSNPITIIPLSNIKEIKLNKFIASYLFEYVPLEIKCYNGKVYRILWAPLNEMDSFSLQKNKKLKGNIENLVNIYRHKRKSL
jgi:hypothetical protein